MDATVLEAGVFFVPPTGLVSTVDPYALLGIAESAPQGEIARALETPPPSREAALGSFLADPASRLAWHLLRPPAAPPSARQFARARRSADDRVACAAHLLAAAISREVQHPQDSSLDELWMEAEARWGAIADDPASHEWASTLAARLGMEEAEGVARSVLAAIKTELLPGLHALFAVGTWSEERREAHRARADGEGAPIVRLCSRQWRLAGIVAARRTYADCRLDQALAAILRLARPLTGIEKAQAAAEVGEFLESACDNLDGVRDGRPVMLIRLVKEIARELPHDYRIIRALCALHLCHAARLLDLENLNGAALQVAKAAVIQPEHPLIPKLIRDIQEKFTIFGAALQETLRSGKQLTTRGHAALKQCAQPMREASQFASSPEGARLRELCSDTLLGQLTARLGLDPSDEAHKAAASALARAIAEGADIGDESTRQALISAHPALTSAPWSAILEVHSTTGCLLELTCALPAPARLDLPKSEREMLRAIHQRLMNAALRWPAPRAALRETIFPWLFSRESTWHKVAAAAGMLSCAIGLGLPGVDAWHADRRDAAYRDLADAVAANDSAAAMAAGRRFFEHASKGTSDERISEVTLQYERALLRELARAATSADESGVDSLIEEARALAVWSAPTGSTAGGEDGK